MEQDNQFAKDMDKMMWMSIGWNVLKATALAAAAGVIGYQMGKSKDYSRGVEDGKVLGFKDGKTLGHSQGMIQGLTDGAKIGTNMLAEATGNAAQRRQLAADRDHAMDLAYASAPIIPAATQVHVNGMH